MEIAMTDEKIEALRNQAVAELTRDWQAWISRYGEGRNEAGMRFGQWYLNTYFRDTVYFPEAFHAENASDAYSIMLHAL